MTFKTSETLDSEASVAGIGRSTIQDVECIQHGLCEPWSSLNSVTEHDPVSPLDYGIGYSSRLEYLGCSSVIYGILRLWVLCDRGQMISPPLIPKGPVSISC